LPTERALAFGAALLLGAAVTPLAAQGRSAPTEAQRVDTVVVTASRREERLRNTVVATELIGAREIARAPVADLGALLSRFAGIQLDAGVPAGHGVALRGLGGPRVLILIDGQPMAGRVNGTLDLARIPLRLIERVEVVKGPQSTLYGSAAMGGVINVVTRRPANRGAEVGVAALSGSQQRRELAGHAEGGSGEWSARLDGGGTLLGIAPGVDDIDGARTLRAHVAPRITRRGSDSTWALDVSALAVDEAQRFKVGQLYSFADNAQIGVQVGATRRRGLTRFAPVASWSRFDHLSRRASTPTPASDSGAHDVQDLVQVETPLSHVFARGIVDAGLLLRRESITADRVPGGQRTAHSAEPYGQLSFGVGPTVVTAGARLALHEQWGTFLAPRLAVLWRPSDAVALRVGTGLGFRTPDFKELFLEFANTAAGYSVVGNPDLMPERSANLSTTITINGARGELRIQGHAARYSDFIETTLIDTSTSTYGYRNLAEGRIAGSEVELVSLVGAARIEVSHAYLWSRDETSRRPLLGRTPHTATIGATLPTRRAELSMRALWNSRTPIGVDESTGEMTHRAAFGQLDLGASRRVLDRLTVRTGVANVLDARPQGTWPSFVGRQWFIGLEID
jgi:outer membrane receptor for ferrienterochelin and colicins